MNPFGPALCLLAALLGAGTAAAVESRELASVVVMDATPPLFGMPAGAPRPVWYNVPDSLAAGCGLVRPETPTRIDPLLEPEAESDWPSCQGFIDGAAFRWRDGPAYVFRYRQRDTREDTYTVSAFVTAKADNQGAFDALNAKDTPKIKSVRKLAAWGKATLAGLAAANAAYQDSPRDAIQTDHAYLSLARDGGSSTCRISADLVAEDSGFPPLTAPCTGILATTALEAGSREYFIALLDGPGRHPKGLVIVAAEHSVSESQELERQLAPAIAGGNILAVKSALRRLVGSP